MQFAFFYSKDIQKFFWNAIDFVEDLEMTQIARGARRGWGHVLCVIMTQCVRKLICDSDLIRKCKTSFIEVFVIGLGSRFWEVCERTEEL